MIRVNACQTNPRTQRDVDAIDAVVAAAGKRMDQCSPPEPLPAARVKFKRLRARYARAQDVRDRFELTLRAKYGAGFQPTWLRAAENRTVDRLRENVDAAARDFFTHLTAISPRDWSYGVPAHWLYEELSYEDAVRPIGESLSVTPPLSYGATEARS